MEVEQPAFVFDNACVAIREIDFAVADGFDLAAHEGDASLEFLDHKIIVQGTPVLNQDHLPSSFRIRSF